MAVSGITKVKDMAEQSVTFMEWAADQLRKKNWPTILSGIGMLMLIFANPLLIKNVASLLVSAEFLEQHPLPSDENLYLYWGASVAPLFLTAFVIIYRTRPKGPGGTGLSLSERGAIKGLVSFGYQDAEIFEQLGRNAQIRFCLDAVCAPDFRFGILQGESGCGKSSFLQAGLWPRLDKRGFDALYVQCTERPPLESIRSAIGKQLGLPAERTAGLDLAALLDLAAETARNRDDPKELILVLDQFEQFFTHQRYKVERQPFVDALTAWYRRESPYPIRILVSIRSDLAWHMFEIQEALGYALGPNQSFLLKKFEPVEAATIFGAMADSEEIPLNLDFIEELCEKELASPLDGLVSPVDLQILAWMTMGHRDPTQRTFDRASFQRFGGLEGLLNRFLERMLETRETEERRQGAVKVLLALIDLDNNVRGGVFTPEEVGDTLVGTLEQAEIDNALAWLTRPDVRLVTPRDKGEQQGYELAHERIIPAVRQLAGKALTTLDQANQLLERRVNEWLGNNESSRYLLRWRELRLIKAQRPNLIWRGNRRQKKELIRRSQVRMRRAYTVVAVVILLPAGIYGLSQTPRGQTWLVHKQLADEILETANPQALTLAAQAFVVSGSIKLAEVAVQQIKQLDERAQALQSLAQVALELKDPTLVNAQLEWLRGAAEGIDNARHKTVILLSLAEVAMKFKDPALATEWLKAARNAAEGIDDARSKAQTLQSLAQVAMELKDPALVSAQLEGLRAAAEGIDDAGYKAQTLQSLAQLALGLKDPALVSAQLEGLGGAAEGIDNAWSKAQTLQSLAQLALKLKDPALATEWLKAARNAAEGIDDARSKAETLQSLAQLALGLKDPALVSAQLEGLRGAAEGIDNAWSKAQTLQSLAQLALKLKDPALATEWLKAARNAAEGIDDAWSKAATLRSLAQVAMELKEPALVSAQLEGLRGAAEGIDDAGYKAKTLQSLAQLALELKEPALATEWLKAARNATEDIIDHAGYKAETLQSLAQQVAMELKDPALVNAQLEGLRGAAEGIDDAGYKAETLRSLAQLALELKDPALVSAQLEGLRGATEDIDHVEYKAQTLQSLAQLALKLKDPALVSAQLEGLYGAAERMDDARSKAETLQSLAQVVLELKEPALATEWRV